MYEQTVRWICELQNRKRKFAEYYDYLIGGGVAGLAFWTVIYPCDVVKTRVQSGSSYKQAFENIIQTSYRGFGNIAFRSVLVNAVGFATFEQFKGAFNLLRLTAMH